MAVSYKPALIAAILLATGALYIYAGNDSPSYSRQDCIQKVVFDWGSRSSEEVESVIEAMADVLEKEWLKQADPTARIPDYIFPFYHRAEWYLQYRQACEQKKERTTDLMLKVLVPAIPQLPGYVISDEQVVPSSRTIDIRGGHWKADDF